MKTRLETMTALRALSAPNPPSTLCPLMNGAGFGFGVMATSAASLRRGKDVLRGRKRNRDPDASTGGPTPAAAPPRGFHSTVLLYRRPTLQHRTPLIIEDPPDRADPTARPSSHAKPDRPLGFAIGAVRRAVEPSVHDIAVSALSRSDHPDSPLFRRSASAGFGGEARPGQPPPEYLAASLPAQQRRGDPPLHLPQSPSCLARAPRQSLTRVATRARTRPRSFRNLRIAAPVAYVATAEPDFAFRNSSPRGNMLDLARRDGQSANGLIQDGAAPRMRRRAESECRRRGELFLSGALVLDGADHRRRRPPPALAALPVELGLLLNERIPQTSARQESGRRRTTARLRELAPQHAAYSIDIASRDDPAHFMTCHYRPRDTEGPPSRL